MTDSEDTLAGPAVKVAQDLTAILTLCNALTDQAVHKATDREMPGGDATVQLAHVANLEAWRHKQDAAESAYYAARDLGLEVPWPETTHEDENDQPALQSLLFWTEDLRREHDQELGHRTATVASEANFLRWALNWMWDNEPHFADMAADVSDARTQLENLLRAGERSERGVPCMYDECKGVRLVRKLEPTGDGKGHKTWRHTDWHCPNCKRAWDDDHYWANVNAANERAKAEDIGGQTWCTVDYAERKVGRSAKTIRTWINRHEIATACIISGKRGQFVMLEEVRARHLAALTRSRTRAS